LPLVSLNFAVTKLAANARTPYGTNGCKCSTLLEKEFARGATTLPDPINQRKEVLYRVCQRMWPYPFPDLSRRLGTILECRYSRR
jgi:hypothetical protein